MEFAEHFKLNGRTLCTVKAEKHQIFYLKRWEYSTKSRKQ